MSIVGVIVSFVVTIHGVNSFGAICSVKFSLDSANAFVIGGGVHSVVGGTNAFVFSGANAEGFDASILARLTGEALPPTLVAVVVKVGNLPRN